jgi:hypothetical protein
MGQIVLAHSLRMTTLVCVTVAAWHAAGPAHAAESNGCLAANRGDLTADMTAGADATRSAPLIAGETLTISVVSRAAATVDLIGGPGAPRRLYSGTGSQTIAFAASETATYAFTFGGPTAGEASVRVTCMTAQAAAARDDFLARRRARIIAQEPDRVRIDRPDTPPPPAPTDASEMIDADGTLKPSSFTVSLGELAAATTFGNSNGPRLVDFWVQGRYEPYATALGPGDGALSTVFLGSDYKLGPDIMIGALAQFDRMDEADRPGNQVAASGWMAGPYMSVRFGPGVFFDGRAAWGLADSGVTGIGIDTAAPDRKMVSGRLRGSRALGAWTLAPSVGLSYVEDGVAAQSEDAGKAALPAGQGRIEVLPEVKRRFQMDSKSYIEPRAAVGAFMNFDDLANMHLGHAEGEDLRMKAEAGVAVGLDDGMNLEAKTGVESGGASAAETWSGRLQLNMPLGN